MPSEIFYRISFSVSITVPFIGLTFSFLIIFIVLNNRKCHNVKNLLICDLCVASIIYFLLHLVGCYYGFRDHWYDYQPLCILRAYFILVSLAAMSYSFFIRAVSCLFFTVFYEHRFLQTCRTHWILVIVKWLGSFLLAIRPLFIENGFELVPEHRMCGMKTNKLSVAPYSIILLYVFPKCVVIIIYALILYRVRQSARRTRSKKTINSPATYVSLTSVKKNVRIMRNMLFILNILMCGGAPYLVLIAWDSLGNGNAPKELYFLSVNSLVLSNTIMAIVSFYQNKTIKNLALTCLFKHRTRL